ncbi:hypothetical protein M1590_03985 [Candidatus Marsarchaeota archaeon]|nr:hypothetical protein [Candidatus Marsarchaeota archaeon]
MRAIAASKYKYVIIAVDTLNTKLLFTRQNLAFIALVILIAAIAINFRITMLHDYGFYEPDGFYYYAVIRAAVNNNLSLPAVLSTSGWPSHAPVAEAHGIYWLVLAPYAVLRYFGVSYYTIMRLIPVVFALLDMFAAYLLSRYLSKDRLFGLLVMAFIALSMGNAARTSALIFRGDTFITFFLIMALVFFVEVFRQQSNEKKTMFAAATGITLALGNLVWNGSPFAVATFLLSFIILMLFAFVFRNDAVIEDGKYMLLALVVWYVLANLANLAGIIPVQQMLGVSYIPLYLLVALAWTILYYISKNMVSIMRVPAYRIGLIILGTIIGIAVFFALEPNLITSTLVGNGFISAPGSFASTTQELQPPTFQFLWTSFGINLFTSLPNLMLSIPFYMGIQNSLWVPLYGGLGLVLLVLCFLPYFLMQVYDSGGFLRGKAKLRPDLSIPLVVVMSYFILTAYLQVHVIRFNSLLSVPLAIISAFTLYWLILASLPGIRSFFNHRQSGTTTYTSLQYAKLSAFIILVIMLAVVFYYLLYDANFYSISLVQADNINPLFISAMRWLGANSPTNSVVLTLWPDGSVAEAIANRTVVTDSVGSENGTRATAFAAWLMNDTVDPGFLTSNITGSPNYLIARTPWLIETQGIYTEAMISKNQSLFGYAPLYSFNESPITSNTRRIDFGMGQGPYPRVETNLIYSNSTGAVSGAYAYIQPNPTQSIPFGSLAFYNAINGNFSTISPINQTATNGEMLLLQYSPIPRPGFFVNLTGAYIFAPGLAQSNMLKLLFFCNDYYCSWDNNKATMQLVYSNPDTRIFHIIYNESSSRSG